VNDAQLEQHLRAGVLAMSESTATGDWSAVLRNAAVRSGDGSARLRRSRRRSRQGLLVGLTLLSVLSAGAVYGHYDDWIASQVRIFHPSGASEIKIGDARIVAQLQQHDGSTLEIAETIIPPHVDANPERSHPVERCVATRPAPPADAIAAPADALSLSGSAFCTTLETMAFESNWLADGSGVVLIRRPDNAQTVQLRGGDVAWQPTSADGHWALFVLPPNSLVDGIPVEVDALGATGSVTDTQRIAR
jgi:hypothetical protein